MARGAAWGGRMGRHHELMNPATARESVMVSHEPKGMGTNMTLSDSQKRVSEVLRRTEVIPSPALSLVALLRV